MDAKEHNKFARQICRPGPKSPLPQRLRLSPINFDSFPQTQAERDERWLMEHRVFEAGQLALQPPPQGDQE
jgi:hypothetical protein